MNFILLLVLIFSLIFLLQKLISNQYNSKKANKIISLIFISLTILCFSLYIKYDKERSKYGLNCVFCNDTMPFGIKPKSGNYADGLVLVDDNDFELVGMGFKYREVNFKMGHFLAYGYNDTSIIVKCTNELQNIKYLISYRTNYKSENGNDKISFKELNINRFKQIKDGYRWFELDEEQIQNITTKRSISLVGTFIFFIFLLFTVYQSIRSNIPNGS